MGRRSGILAVISLVVAGVAGATPAAAATSITWTTTSTIQLPGSGGHGDVVVADPAADAVYLSQTPDDNVVVIDTATNTIKAVIGGVPGANGIDFDRDYLFVAENAGSVAVISKKTWTVVATVPAGGTGSDGVYLDARDGTVYVTNDTSNNIEAFSDQAPFAVLGTTDLRPGAPTAGPDLGVYVAETDTIYQSDDNQVDVINARTGRIETVFVLPLAAGVDAKDMYFDPLRQRLWIATTAAELVAVNPWSGRIVDTTATRSGMDEISGDAWQRLLFTGESTAGVMGVVDLANGRYLAAIPTEAGTHTLAYLPGTNRVYVYQDDSNVVDVLAVHR